MPDSTLEAYFEHGDAGDPMPADGGNASELPGRFTEAGVDTDALAAKLQSDRARVVRRSPGVDLLKQTESQTAAALSA
jgi:transaldolase